MGRQWSQAGRGLAWVPLPPKESLKPTGMPVFAMYSFAKREVICMPEVSITSRALPLPLHRADREQ